MTKRISNAPSTQDLGEAYVNWSDNPGSFAKASAQYSKALVNSTPIVKHQLATGAIATRFQNIDSNTSVRDTYSAMDYSFFRPNERVPQHFRDVIAASMGAYLKVPVVKNTIDLMGDFVAQGIRLVHSDPALQNLYSEWFRKVNGPERTERIANCLYMAGNVIVKRANAKLDDAVVSEWKKTIAAEAQDTDLEHEEDTPVKPNEIPYRYTIINPLIVEVLGEHVAAFTGQVHYVLKLPSTFYNTLSLPLTSYDPSILNEGLPRDLQQAMDRNEKYLLLDSEKLVTLFYKKEDWNVWAYPMLYSLLDEVILLQKMKQADMTALDGVISHIRIWKLGSLEHKIFPTNAVIQKLSSILLNHVAGGAMDFVWGPDLELEETGTDIAQFLGSEKYEFVMNTIHAGLGVPAAIGRSKGSMSDNFMSIKVLLERLKYGRQILTRFWNNEIRLFQKALDLKTPAYVYFENMNLQDEVAEKALWIQLADRNIIPEEAVQERFYRIPEIDNILIMREEEERIKGKRVPKTSPYHDAQPNLALKKIALQKGLLTPSQVGLEVDEPLPHEQDLLDSQFPPPTIPDGHKIATTKRKKPTGVSGQGRPKSSKDKTKRKTRTPKPSSKAEEFMGNYLYADQAQKAIADHINPYFLEKFGKKNLRQLSVDEGVEMERFKFQLLYKIPPGLSAIGETVIKDALDYPGEMPGDEIEESYKKVADAARAKKGEELTTDECNRIKSYIYALISTADTVEEEE